MWIYYALGVMITLQFSIMIARKYDDVAPESYDSMCWFLCILFCLLWPLTTPFAFILVVCPWLWKQAIKER